VAKSIKATLVAACATETAPRQIAIHRSRLAFIAVCRFRFMYVKGTCTFQSIMTIQRSKTFEQKGGGFTSRSRPEAKTPYVVSYRE
jgi:hypothetical protein